MKKKRPVKAKEVAAPEGLVSLAVPVEVVKEDVKKINIAYSCQTGKPSVIFEGEWSRKQVRVTLNAILRAYHLYQSTKRKEAIARLTNHE